ncbi:hypothetical protein EIN43_22160 [Enterobacter hormaechei]|uniref:Uncharacterized protein n=1 Tax=Enterobacter hormaechei TaxID=158836 RepID=A0A4Y5ZRU6_9ENTR|nr:hypothetical protein EIN43_22160 [Enterobacter hormaechei]
MSRLIPENPYTSAGWHSRQNQGREVAIWHYQRGNIIPFNKPLKNQVVKLKTFCTMQQLAYYNSAYIMRRAKIR